MSTNEILKPGAGMHFMRGIPYNTPFDTDKPFFMDQQIDYMYNTPFQRPSMLFQWDLPRVNFAVLVQH